MVFNVDHHLVARQMRRQGAVVAVGPRRAALLLLRRVRSVLPSLVLGDALLEILQSEL